MAETDQEFPHRVVSGIETELRLLMPDVAIRRCFPHAALDIGEEDDRGVEMEVHVDRDIIVFWGTGHEHFPLPSRFAEHSFDCERAACNEISTVVEYIMKCWDADHPALEK
jgi:hypothetical protein